ncbi:hypothetical protein KVV02_002123 [Mortierella alpina]|uniref:Uncharacterized protein n=1 Tax=Mortierella alpina TaxID=64518 RepID=A0A9P8A1S3_MORAP|nr:hypothetical protein KVV02_002123 [Mortierella alpina]
MATKQRRRKQSRREQSKTDKNRVLMADTTYSEPLREYTSFLDHLKSHGYARDEFTRIPLNLIDLAAAIITSMITGRELSLFGDSVNEPPAGLHHHLSPEQQQPADNTLGEDSDVYNFIQRMLKRTQLSCTTLILALVYIDRFKARVAQTLKRRTRLDQGPDYDQMFSTSIMLQHTSSHQSMDGSVHHPDIICADKYLFDATYSNAEWADFTKGQYTTRTINDLERRFLGHLQYKLYVSEPEFDGFLSYLEVVLALKQVWGRGLITFSYSDVRILTQQLMPSYAGRLHFRTLQGDMMLVVWQVMSTLARVYLTVVGTFMIAAASYAAVMELSALGSLATMDAAMPSPSPMPPRALVLDSLDPLLPRMATEALATHPSCCTEQILMFSTHGTGDHRQHSLTFV